MSMSRDDVDNESLIEMRDIEIGCLVHYSSE